MLLPIDMKFAARKVHFLQNEGPKFEPVGNFTVPLPCVHNKKLKHSPQTQMIKNLNFPANPLLSVEGPKIAH